MEHASKRKPHRVVAPPTRDQHNDRYKNPLTRVFVRGVRLRISHHTAMRRGIHRQPEVDAVRALALLRVFLWHATGWAALTWVAAVPVMVFVTGLLTGGVVEKDGSITVAKRRLTRLLLPYWFFVAVVFSITHILGGGLRVVDIVSWVLPFKNPTNIPWESGWLSTPLWYMRLMLWLYILLPFFSWAAKRVPRTSVMLLLGGTVFGEVFLRHSLWAVQDVVMYGAFFAFGMSLAAKGLPGISRKWFVLLVGGSVGAGVWVAVNGTTGVVNDSHTLHLLVGVATLGVLGALVGRIKAETLRCGKVLGWISGYSLTIYLWHSAAVFLVMKVTAKWRGALGDGVLVRVLVVSLSVALVLSFTPLLGVVERRIAGRDFSRVRSSSVLRGSAFILATVAVLLVVQLRPPETLAEAYELRVPSQAPVVNEAASDNYGAVIAPPSTVRVVPGDDDVSRETRTETTLRAAGGASELGAVLSVESLGVKVPEEDARSIAMQEALNDFAVSVAARGVSVLVLKPGVGSWFGGAGEEPVARDEAQGLMSITKTFTAMLVFRAAEDGLIKLDEPIGELKNAPWFSPALDTTWLEFLGHQTGLKNYRDTKAYAKDAESINEWEPALKAVLADGRGFAPGERVEYSSTNYIVLGVALEELYGEPVEDLIRERLLGPLGLGGIEIDKPGPREPNTGTAGMRANVDDVARWAYAVWGAQRVISGSSGMINWAIDSRWLVGPGSEGFCPCTSQSVSAIGYSGGTNSVRWYPEEGVVIVLMSRETIWGSGTPPKVDALCEKLVRTIGG